MKSLILALVCALPSFAAITRVGGTFDHRNTSGTTLSTPYTATTGNFLVVFCGSYGSIASLNITDGTNTYVADQFLSYNGTQERGQVSHATNITGGALTITCTASSTASFGLVIEIEEYSGIVTSSPVDAAATTNTGTGTTATGAAYSTSNASDLLIGAAFNGGNLTSAGSGWTAVQTSNGNSSVNLMLMEQIVSSTGTYTASATVVSSRYGVITIGYKGLGTSYVPKHRITQQSASTPLLPQLGTYSQDAITSNAYWQTGLNMTSVVNNNLATFNGNQYACWIDTGLQVNISKRNLTSHAVTTYATGFTVSDNDEHRTCSITLDSTGIIHIWYGMHDQALIYRKSTNPEDPSAFSGLLSMLGTNEASVTYPFPIIGAGGSLYFTFRDGGTGAGNQYLYAYNTGTQTWAAAAGTGTAGIFINGKATPYGPYLAGPPKWDSHGNLWFAWMWNNTGINLYVIEWTGSGFKTFAGATATIPATNTNSTPIATGNFQIQCQMSIDRNDVIYIPTAYNDGSGYSQVHVFDSYTGSFVDHQLTSNTFVTDPTLVPYPMAVSSGAYTYVIYPDAYGQKTGMLGWQSSNGFSTAQQFYVFQNYNPNWELSYDPQRAPSIISFLMQYSNDPVYGTSPGGSPILQVIDWTTP